jgi:hypothetical protein
LIRRRDATREKCNPSTGTFFVSHLEDLQNCVSQEITDNTGPVSQRKQKSREIEIDRSDHLAR